VIRGYLHSAINMPTGSGITFEYRNTETESISVVLFRTAMGVTEVAEVRDVLRIWVSSLSRPEPTDLLPWRQRTGYDFAYLATREEHRVGILHRLLCAIWNGKATVQGLPASPDAMRVSLGSGQGVRLSLRLTSFGKASSWASLLRAYELWALDDDEIHHLFCEQLMRQIPDGLDTTPVAPDPLYLTVIDMAAGQIDCLDEMLVRNTAAGSRVAQMRSFWAETLPAALQLPFETLQSRVASNLDELARFPFDGS
jgi:hypothetical protein